MKEQKIGYFRWLSKLKYILIGADILPRDEDVKIQYKNIPDQDAWKHFWKDGYTPLEAVNIDINEGGEL